MNHLTTSFGNRSVTNLRCTQSNCKIFIAWLSLVLIIGHAKNISWSKQVLVIDDHARVTSEKSRYELLFPCCQTSSILFIVSSSALPRGPKLIKYL